MAERFAHCRCRGDHLGLLEQLPDTARLGRISYRAFSGGELDVDYLNRRAGIGKATTGATEAAQLPVQPMTKTPVKLKPSATKIGTVEALVCTQCGALALQVQDPQFIEIEESVQFRPEEAMKRCRRCKGQKLGWLDRMPDTVGDETQFTVSKMGVMQREGRQQTVGRIGAIVCTECGLLDLVVADAASIDFEKLEGFSWLHQESGPYR